MINGGDFNWEFIFVAVRQEDKGSEDEDKARGESGSTTLRDPGLTGVSGMTLTKEYTGTVMLLDETDKVVVAGAVLTDP